MMNIMLRQLDWTSYLRNAIFLLTKFSLEELRYYLPWLKAI